MRMQMLAVVLLCAGGAAAQTAPMMESPDHGAYGALTVQVAKDSLNGYSNLWTPAIGFDVHPQLSLELGVPYYALVSSAVQKTTVSRSGLGITTEQTSVSNVLGDVYLRGVFVCSACGRVGYVATVKGTAPTGDTTAGVSTGRATWSVNNHVELTEKRVTPYLEAGVGNTVGDSTKYYRAYTTLGYIAPFAAGLTLGFGRHVSFDASSYYDLPFGEQKLYSREVARGTVLAGSTRRSRPILDQYLSEGGATLTEDHGYNGSLAIAPTRRVTLTASYNRSIPDALDSLTFALSLRVGHVAQ